MIGACGRKLKGKRFCCPLRVLQLNAEIQVFASAIQGAELTHSSGNPTLHLTQTSYTLNGPEALKNPYTPIPRNLLRSQPQPPKA